MDSEAQRTHRDYGLTLYLLKTEETTAPRNTGRCNSTGSKPTPRRILVAFGELNPLPRRQPTCSNPILAV